MRKRYRLNHKALQRVMDAAGGPIAVERLTDRHPSVKRIDRSTLYRWVGGTHSPRLRSFLDLCFILMLEPSSLLMLGEESDVATNQTIEGLG